MQVDRNNNPSKRSNDINQIWCQCHPLHLPSHQGLQKQEHTIHQWRKEAGGATCTCWLSVLREWMKVNSNVVWLDLWYLTKVQWDVSELRIQMGIWKTMISQMKKGSNHHEKMRARWGVLCGKKEYAEGVGGAQKEDEHQIKAQVRRRGLIKAQICGGVPKVGGG